jgi:hypothetical protein
MLVAGAVVKKQNARSSRCLYVRLQNVQGRR